MNNNIKQLIEQAAVSHYESLDPTTPRSENIIHPYTYLPAIGEKWGNDNETVLLWYDYESGEQLPTYFGLGTGVQELVDEWCKQRNEYTTRK